MEAGLRREPSYGKKVIEKLKVWPRKILSITLAASLATALVLFILYTRTGDKTILMGLAIILAFIPFDIALIYGFLSTAPRILLEEIDTIIETLQPETYSLTGGLGTITLTLQLSGGHLILILLQSQTASILYLENPAILKRTPGKKISTIKLQLRLSRLIPLKERIKTNVQQIKQFKPCYTTKKPVIGEIEIPDPQIPGHHPSPRKRLLRRNKV